MKGKVCKLHHPKRCSKLMCYGTEAPSGYDLGKNCPEFHPKMCPMLHSQSDKFDTHGAPCHTKVAGRKRKKILMLMDKQKDKQVGYGAVKQEEKQKNVEREDTTGLKSRHQSFYSRSASSREK